MGYRRREYDYLVVGGGGLGTSVAYFLSHLPGRTLVLERFYENHPFGSSHGKTRILRTAYAEGSVFVPLVLRARELWKDLNREAGQQIFRPTGVLLVGRRDSPEVDRARESARSYGLPYELLSEEAAPRRFPAFHFTSDDVALWDPGGGVLFPERAIHSYRRLAFQRGVRFRWNSPLERWDEQADGRIRVGTPNREYIAERVVLAVGAWLPSLTRELHLPLRVEQQTVFWFRPRPGDHHRFRTMPAFVWYGSRGEYFYGTPDLGNGVKIGGSQGQAIRNPARRPPPSARELRSVQEFRDDRLPGLSSRALRAVRCLYTNTPDQNFIVDLHPGNPRIILASACSGHGFKFVSALGELIATAAGTGKLSAPLAPFRLPSPRAPRSAFLGLKGRRG